MWPVAQFDGSRRPLTLVVGTADRSAAFKVIKTVAFIRSISVREPAVDATDSSNGQAGDGSREFAIRGQRGAACTAAPPIRSARSCPNPPREYSSDSYFHRVAGQR